jgi:hypothetical protein
MTPEQMKVWSKYFQFMRITSTDFDAYNKLKWMWSDRSNLSLAYCGRGAAVTCWCTPEEFPVILGKDACDWEEDEDGYSIIRLTAEEVENTWRSWVNSILPHFKGLEDELRAYPRFEKLGTTVRERKNALGID